MISFESLPDDMRVLISDLICGVDQSNLIPEYLPTRIVKINDLPVVPLNEYDRGTIYARKMRVDDVPPMIVAYNQFVDGKHRRLSFSEQGINSVTVIDLTGIADPRMIEMCSMGELGTGIVFDGPEEDLDALRYAVWDYRLNSFIKKDGSLTRYLVEADEYSRNEICKLYPSQFDYVIFIPDFYDNPDIELIVEQNQDKEWVWHFEGHEKSESIYSTCSTVEQCIKEAKSYALSLMTNTRTPNPFYLDATRTPLVVKKHERESKKSITRRSREDVSVFDWG